MAIVNKGKWDNKLGYQYTCYRCGGNGAAGNCSECYGLNYTRIMQAFRTARGTRYYALLKAALSIRGLEIYKEVKSAREFKGKLSPADLCHYSVRFQFPMNRVKPFAEWLEETGVIPYGAYRRTKERGFKPMIAMKKMGIVECNRCSRPYYLEESSHNGQCMWCENSQESLE